MRKTNIQKAYNEWSTSYNEVENKTRDLEAVAIRELLKELSFGSCLEIGCGTGKNTRWLAEHCERLTGVDLSENMLERAKSLDLPSHVELVQADVTSDWGFVKNSYELVSFSLVLEHIPDLDSILSQTSEALLSGGHVYIGELHPFKQYQGSKARFETSGGTKILDCYQHHVSDYLESGKNNGLTLVELREFFDSEEKNEIPRILGLLFRKT